MKIALAQINTTVADFDGILQKIEKFSQEALKKGASLVAFPELTLTGYPPRDLVEHPYFVDQNLQTLEEVARLSQKIDIVVGYVDRNEKNIGKRLINAAALCRGGKVVARYSKNLLPTYDVFDEGRYFEPGSVSGLWDDIGISICEDCWNDKLFWQQRLYERDPVEEQVQQGAKWLLNISASPFSVGKPELRRQILQALALKHGVPLAYVNLVGGNDELVFDGRSLVVNARGEIVAEGKAYEEDLLVVDLDLKDLKAVEKLPVIDERSDVFRTLVTGTRDYLHKCGFKKAIIGLSGGIDSALVAVIAAEALGRENVLGVALPSPYSSEDSLNDAKILAEKLKINFETISIETVYDAYRQLSGKKSGDAPDLADENLQARIRGNILMSFSNRQGALVLSTGNKSELAMGYCTLYGDMSGGLSVIADVPKTLVYEIARYANEKHHAIPENTFTKAPTAELRPNQKDQDTLPPYEVLDPILKAIIEDKQSEKDVIQMGFDPDVVRFVMKKFVQNEYKRRQSAPGIKVTAKAFGIGRRYPVARKI